MANERELDFQSETYFEFSRHMSFIYEKYKVGLVSVKLRFLVMSYL